MPPMASYNQTHYRDCFFARSSVEKILSADKFPHSQGICPPALLCIVHSGYYETVSIFKYNSVIFPTCLLGPCWKPSNTGVLLWSCWRPADPLMSAKDSPFSATNTNLLQLGLQYILVFVKMGLSSFKVISSVFGS